MGTYDNIGGAALHDKRFDDDPACEICHKTPSDCVCPECPKCGSQGDPECYGKHFCGLINTNKWLCPCGATPSSYSLYGCNK